VAKTSLAILGRAGRKLDRYPDLAYRIRSRGIDVPPPGEQGFPIRIRVRTRGYRVFLGGWYRDFDRDDDVLDCLDFALSKGCRLEVEYRGHVEVAWTVQSREFGAWRAHHRVRRWLVPFWKPKRTGCLQNDVRQLFAGEVKDGEPVAPGLAEA
jgi:hypothetical protein